MEQEIQRADPQYRKHLFVLYGVGLLICAGVFMLYSVFIRSYMKTASLFEIISAVEKTSVVFLAAFFIPAIYCIRFGRKVVQLEILPYPGMRVIRDTKIIRGKKAVTWGRIMEIFGYSAICINLFGIVATLFVCHRFREDILSLISG